MSLRIWVRSLASSGVAANCGVGHRCSLDPKLLWLWCRQTAAATPIQPLTQKFPYAIGAAVKKNKKGKKIYHVFDKHLSSIYSIESIPCFITPIKIIFCTEILTFTFLAHPQNYFKIISKINYNVFRETLTFEILF